MKKSIALYNPYLDTLGGGEKHILSILKIFDEQGYQITIFWNNDLTSPIKKKFCLSFNNSLKFIPNIFKDYKPFINPLKTLQTLRTFDYFFYVTDGSYFFSPAKKNFVFCMVPNKKLYQFNPINRLKTLNYQFISNSKFTHQWLKNWGIGNKIIYPFIDNKFIENSNIKKEMVILSVGRFFTHLHAKQQEIIIKLFNKIRQSSKKFADLKLLIAGSCKQENRSYLLYLKNLIKNKPSIILKPNIAFIDLLKFYKKSLFFWHMTGYGIDENRHPEQVEHLGIAPLEAMASGCITFCYNAGGPKEIIQDGKTGFLFNNEQDLIKKMSRIISDSNRQKNIQLQAKKYIEENFSYQVFKQNIKQIINF